MRELPAGVVAFIIRRMRITDHLRRRSVAFDGCACLVVLVALFAVSPAGAWQPATLYDPIRDDETTGVFEQNARGFRLEIVRGEGGEAIAIFRLPPGAGDFLAAGKSPTLRLDDQPVVEVALRDTGLTWAAFAVWNGEGKALTGLLRDLMSARRAEIVYFLDGGGYKDAEFDLSGAREVIAQEFEVPAEVDAAEVARAHEIESALLEEAARCNRLKGKKRQACIDQVKACAQGVASATELRACTGG